MLVMNLFVEYENRETFAQDEQDYPDEVLKSGWNPVLAEFHQRLVSEKQITESKSEEEAG